jgi:hypothetical protein
MLVFLDRQEARRDRQEDRADRIRMAAVASGRVDLRAAWPEFFGPAAQEAQALQDEPDVDPGVAETAFPSTDADMSDFRWERPTPDSFRSDMDALLSANEQVSVGEEPEVQLRVTPSLDTEWT